MAILCKYFMLRFFVHAFSAYQKHLQQRQHWPSKQANNNGAMSRGYTMVVMKATCGPEA